MIDEAYVDFGGESAISLVKRYPNLLVVQTLSKSRSLAGLRVGFAVGHPDLIEALERVKNSFNSYPLDRLAIAGAVAALEDREWFDRTRQAVISSRDKLVSIWKRWASRCCPRQPTSSSPAIPRHDAEKSALALRQRSDHRAPFQAAADRAVPAHHRRHRRAVRDADRGVAGNLARTAATSGAPAQRRPLQPAAFCCSKRLTIASATWSEASG